MIAEHTAQDGPTRNVLMTRLSSQPAFASIEAAPAVSRIAQQARTLAMASLRALSSWGSPSYFQLERRAPEHRRLGPGVTRVSDSFWPLSEW